VLLKSVLTDAEEKGLEAVLMTLSGISEMKDRSARPMGGDAGERDGVTEACLEFPSSGALEQSCRNGGTGFGTFSTSGIIPCGREVGVSSVFSCVCLAFLLREVRLRVRFRMGRRCLEGEHSKNLTKLAFALEVELGA